MKPTVKLSPKQGKAYALLRPEDKDTSFIGFGGGAYGGKSWLGSFWLLNMCLEFPETRWFIGREELKRLRQSTLQTFWKVCAHYNIPQNLYTYNGQDHYIQFSNGSRIDLLELKYYPSDPLYERFGSIEYTGGWIEEAGEVHFGAFDTLKSRIGRQKNDEYSIVRKMLLTFNPKKNWLYQRFYLPWKNDELPDNYAFVQSLVYDNPFRDKAAVEGLQEIENKAQRQRLLEGLWEYDDAPDQLIPYRWVERAQKVMPKDGFRKVGIDVARYGDDSTVFCRIHGNNLMEYKVFTENDIAETTVEAEQYLKQYTVEAQRTAVDTVGLGAGVFDNLKANGLHCREFVAGAKPVEDAIQKQSKYEFADLRSQMWWSVREQLRKENLCLAAISDYPQLLEDLTAPTYEIRKEKEIKVESKDDIKQRLGRSTDYGDAFVQAVCVDRLSKHKTFWTVT